MIGKKLHKGMLSKAFSFAVNVAAIGGIKATATTAVALNPFGLGAIATIAVTGAVTGVAIAGYKKWRHGHNWKEFRKNAVTHSLFGMAGGGASLFLADHADDIWSGLTSLFNNHAPPSVVSFAEHLFHGLPLFVTAAADGGVNINAPNANIVLNESQLSRFSINACNEIDNCTLKNPNIKLGSIVSNTDYIKTPPTLEQSSFIVNISDTADCDVGCANGEGSLLCPYISDLTKAPTRIAFDMEQTEEITKFYCDQSDACDISTADIGSLVTANINISPSSYEITIPSDNDIALNIPPLESITIPTDQSNIGAISLPEETNTPEKFMVAEESFSPEETTPFLFSHTVERGENLWKIAKNLYGDGEQYKLIVQANIEKYPELLENPDLIYPDMALIIPNINAEPAQCVTGNTETNRQTICKSSMVLAA